MSDKLFILSQLILIDVFLLLTGVAFGVSGRRKDDTFLMDLGSYLATCSGFFSLLAVLFYLIT